MAANLPSARLFLQSGGFIFRPFRPFSNDLLDGGAKGLKPAFLVAPTNVVQNPLCGFDRQLCMHCGCPTARTVSADPQGAQNGMASLLAKRRGIQIQNLNGFSCKFRQRQHFTVESIFKCFAEIRFLEG